MIGLDLRSLGLFRLAVGVVLVLDWMARGMHLRAHYTDQGIFPLRLFLNQPDLEARLWSVFYLNDSTWFVTALFALGLVGALGLTLGYQTRWSGWLSWVLLASVQHRNPMLLHLGDSYFLLLLFWGNFLPWGKAFSLDGWSKKEPLTEPYVAIPGVCYLAQVCLLYWFTALLRTHPTWQVDGTALYQSFSLGPLVKEPAYLLLGAGPKWLSFFTFASLWLEAFGPFLLLLPWSRVRLLGVGLIIAFHLGIFAALDIGNFAWICIAGALGLLPATVWDSALGRRVEKALTRTRDFVVLKLPARVVEHRLPTPGPRWAFLGHLLPGLALVAVCTYLWVDFKGYEKPRAALGVMRVTGLNQRWGMFSPSPLLDFGWQSARAQLETGLVVDLITGKPYPQGRYRGERSWSDQRWASYRNNLVLSWFGPQVKDYLDYLVSRWNLEHPEDVVVSAEYLWHKQSTQPDYLLPPERIQIQARYHR